ncbi:hypothetical protein QE449_003823 [Rhodococcus sp. SORGH_AS303]|nr:hypothetical protein [Rhodococcus sp. SORGH_AS_0303]
MNTPNADTPTSDTPRRGRRGRIWARVTENYLAWLLLMAGTAAAGALLTALAGGFEGWTVVAAIATVVLFAGCWFSYRDGARRGAAEQHIIQYHPDSPDEVIDIDTDTGERQPHQD